jgi:hypothetical protein
MEGVIKFAHKNVQNVQFNSILGSGDKAGQTDLKLLAPKKIRGQFLFFISKCVCPGG